jgi:hypothetical protein
MAPLTDRSQAPPAVVCVTGMHRSGTSLAARSLDLLGVSLGRRDGLLDPGPDNVAGYWENAEIKELDDVLLAALGGSWDEPPLLAPGWEADPSLDGLREQARDVIERAFPDHGRAGPVGFKDPRASLLLPFWRTVVTVRTTVVVVRDPAEVTRSLATRDGMRASQAALLWIRYLLAATGEDPGHLLVTQPAFFADLPGTLARIAAHVGAPAPAAEVVRRAREHLDPGLLHHRRESEAAGDGGPLGGLADVIWNGGDVQLAALPAPARDAFAQGWVRDPGDADLLATSRAEVVALTEEIRRRNRVRDAQLSTRFRRRVRSTRRWLEARAHR